jgi:autotransporter-associated beta strand protein
MVSTCRFFTRRFTERPFDHMKRSPWFVGFCYVCGLLLFALTSQAAPSLMENLGRGTVAIRTSPTEVFVSWRMLGTDASDVSFNVYRSTGGGAAVKLNGTPLVAPTHLIDGAADLTQTNAYSIAAIVGGVEQAADSLVTLPANAEVKAYLSLPLQIPAGGVTPSGEAYGYTANDCSVGDLDGDGEYEMIVKWEPTNAKDNSQDGYTGNVFLDGYKLDGTRLWRIDLGRNIRAGAHYTQFLVYDFDGDGRAELVCKTAPNSKDGTGVFIGQPGKFLGTPSAAIDHNADYRNSAGYVLTGPEFFTIFDGLTGAELATTNYVVPRNNNPASGDVNAWGDDYGNRVDRFLACVAYLDGQRPSIVLCRGYYTRAVLAAWDWRGGQLTPRWVFDTDVGNPNAPYAAWRGQGAHSLTVGDVDADGRDEITFGAAAIDDDGTGLYSTLLGHGDALHMSDMDPARAGLEVWMVHESPSSYGANGSSFRDGRTGEIIFGLSGQNSDVGRGCAGDIDPRHVGYELWSSRGSLVSATGAAITNSKPPMNFMCWWDGDLLRETLDGITIGKWNWLASSTSPLLVATGASSNNSTKATPNLSADFLGDWREEVVWRASDSSELRIYSTTIPTTYRFPTLMHDRMYRVAIAWQNVAYNQPPHPGFYLGEGMNAPPAPDIVTSLAALGTPTPAVHSINRYNPSTSGTGATSVTFRVTFNTPVAGVDAADFAVVTAGSVVGTVSAVSAQSAVAYNVTVGSITGTGTIRLDLNASGTGITALADGAAIAGGFTAGETYNRATLAWTRQTTGGLWSDAANWDGGVIGDGANSVPIFGNFDLQADNTVTLDSARTIGGFTFGDALPASPASWIITDGGDPANVLTLDVTSGNATATVGALGTGAVVTLDVPLAGSDGFAKAGAGTLVIAKPSTITGGVNVGAGILRIGTGGTLASTAATGISGSGTQLNVAGGSFTSSGLVTINAPSSLVLDSGTLALPGGVRTNNSDAATLRINGGTFTTTAITVQRNGGASPNFAAGVIVTGGTSTVGSVGLGTNNSTGTLSVEGGSFTATGAVTVGNQASGGRGGAIRVLGGRLTSTEATNGIILSRVNGTNANNVASLTVTGGVATAEKITLGFNSAVNAGSGTVRVNGGALYLGSGGIVKNGTAGMTTLIDLSSGILGAKAGWSTTHPVALPAGGNIALRAADESGVLANITLAGVLSGAGGFTKTGGGTLTLSAANAFTGDVSVNDGALLLTGDFAAGGAVAVNAGGRFGGTGTAGKPLSLNSGGTVAPGIGGAGTLGGAALTWNGGGQLAFDLGASGDRLALTGAFTKGSAGTYAFSFTPLTPPAIGDSHTLVTFGSTDFSAADFTAEGLGYVRGDFAVAAGALIFTVTSDGSGWNSFNSWVASHGLPADADGPSDDPDGDGSDNLLEFILDGDPATAAPPAISLVKVSAGGLDYPAIQYVRRIARGDVRIETRAATTLDFALPLGSVEVSVTPQDGDLEIVTVRSAVPFDQEPRQFLRLFVTLP